MSGSEAQGRGSAAPDRTVTVSVAVCTKDRPRMLPACLRSIAPELGPGDDLLVMEDGDSDAATVLAGLNCRSLHFRDQGRWKTWMLNRALKMASGDLFLTTDDDCEVPAGWIAAMTAPFTDPTVGITFGEVLGITHLPGSQPVPAAAGPTPLTPWIPTHGAAMAIRREAALAVGGYDERLGTGSSVGSGEEPDLAARIGRLGLTCVVVPTPPVRHLEWRGDEETMSTLMRYERGSGAWLGAAVRREGLAAWPLLRPRLRYQQMVLTQPQGRGPWFGVRAGFAFLGGMARGLTFSPRQFV